MVGLQMKTELPNKALENSLYEQVADRVRSLIAEGTLQTGDRLPSVRKLGERVHYFGSLSPA
jgi:DNA-binding transcriptional regulator YhcF (GntR family)